MKILCVPYRATHRIDIHWLWIFSTFNSQSIADTSSKWLQQCKVYMLLRWGKERRGKRKEGEKKGRGNNDDKNVKQKKKQKNGLVAEIVENGC